MAFDGLFNFFEKKSPTQKYEQALSKQLPPALYQRVLTLRNGLVSRGTDHTRVEDTHLINQLTEECAEYLADQDTQFRTFVSGEELKLENRENEKSPENFNINTLDALTELYNDPENTSPAKAIDQYRDAKITLEEVVSKLSEAGYILDENFADLVEEMYQNINDRYKVAAE